MFGFFKKKEDWTTLAGVNNIVKSFVQEGSHAVRQSKTYPCSGFEVLSVLANSKDWYKEDEGLFLTHVGNARNNFMVTAFVEQSQTQLTLYNINMAYANISEFYKIISGMKGETSGCAQLLQKPMALLWPSMLISYEFDFVTTLPAGTKLDQALYASHSENMYIRPLVFYLDINFKNKGTSVLNGIYEVTDMALVGSPGQVSIQKYYDKIPERVIKRRFLNMREYVLSRRENSGVFG